MSVRACLEVPRVNLEAKQVDGADEHHCRTCSLPLSDVRAQQRADKMV